MKKLLIGSSIIALIAAIYFFIFKKKKEESNTSTIEGTVPIPPSTTAVSSPSITAVLAEATKTVETVIASAPTRTATLGQNTFINEPTAATYVANPFVPETSLTVAQKYEGKIIKTPAGTRYLVEKGLKRKLQNVAAAEVALNTTNIGLYTVNISDADANTIPHGDLLVAPGSPAQKYEGRPVRDPGIMANFIVMNGQRRRLPDGTLGTQIGEKYLGSGWYTNRMNWITTEEANQIPLGANLTA
jgi:hypothetical protein